VVDAQIVHGSTVTTDVFRERKGARLALVANEGFQDLLGSEGAE
jgi:N-methylhydantoinase A/oxoprolinase/acetone carboxylase beta subunit